MKRITRPTALFAAFALTTTGLVFGAVPVGAAPSDDLIAEFTFDDATTGLSGAGAVATPTGAVTLVDSFDGTKAAKT
ncbi:MAG: hypothetical protein LBD97_00380, partial [Bifidobacteriaceae bacterium]|nr:hypothetical protein [Bifidobacteriaceae bacterium]